jgi:hypothetical protein
VEIMHDVKPSADTTPILMEPGERSPFDKSTAAGLVGLVYLARQAFEERRRKQCLEITTAILKIEPTHEEARTIQQSVRSELERDFSNARLLAKDAHSKGDRVLYGEAAAALRRIVDADPDNVEAQNLLHQTLAASYCSPPGTPSSAPSTEESRRHGKRRSVVIGSVAFVVLVVILALPNRTDSQVSAPLPSKSQLTPSVAQNRIDPVPPIPTNAEQALSESPTSAAAPAPMRAGLLRTVEVPPLRPAVVSTPPVAAAKPLMGDLAVSAAVPVEIYRGEENLGSTPTTLQLPSGPQTLEYRYQGLRQSVTHYITAQATTTATISFLTKLQINARPWAQVFVDGARLTPIGQTPLGDVSVPIGSVLVFQNPGHPDKRYRVTARDAAIQITFP